MICPHSYSPQHVSRTFQEIKRHSGSRCLQYKDDMQLYLSFTVNAKSTTSQLTQCLSEINAGINSNRGHLNLSKTLMGREHCKELAKLEYHPQNKEAKRVHSLGVLMNFVAAVFSNSHCYKKHFAPFRTG